jgi:hypothetical protein
MPRLTRIQLKQRIICLPENGRLGLLMLFYLPGGDEHSPGNVWAVLYRPALFILCQSGGWDLIGKKEGKAPLAGFMLTSLA